MRNAFGIGAEADRVFVPPNHVRRSHVENGAVNGATTRMISHEATSLDNMSDVEALEQASRHSALLEPISEVLKKSGGNHEIDTPDHAGSRRHKCRRLRLIRH